MITDHEQKNREIISARKSVNAGELRRFRVPTINFEAQTCWDMISWETRPAGDEDQRIITSFSEPPVLSDLSEETLRLIANSSRVPDQIYRLPSHNQNVERAIQLVSSVSQRASRKQDKPVMCPHCLDF